MDTDEQLLRSYLRGNNETKQTAADKIGIKYFPDLILYAIGKVKWDPRLDSPEDYVTRTFLKLFESISENFIQQHSDHLLAWLKRVLCNLVIDDTRKPRIKYNHVELDGDALEYMQSDNPAQSLEQQETLRDLLRKTGKLLNCMHRLKEQSKAVITIKYFEGQVRRNIAKILEIAPSAVDWAERQGLEQLRQCMESKGGKHHD